MCVPAYPSDILQPCDNGEVVGTKAGAVLTQMIYLHTVRNRPHPYGVRKPVRKHLLSSLITPQQPIPRVDTGSRRFPASVIGDDPVVNQPVLIGEVGRPNFFGDRIYSIALVECAQSTRSNLPWASLHGTGHPRCGHMRPNRGRVGVEATLRHSIMGRTEPARVVAASAPRHLTNPCSRHELHNIHGRRNCYAYCT